MVINNFTRDIRELCASQGISKTNLADSLGIRRQTLHRYEECAGMNQKFVELCDALGYDIEINYIKK